MLSVALAAPEAELQVGCPPCIYTSSHLAHRNRRSSARRCHRRLGLLHLCASAPSSTLCCAVAAQNCCQSKTLVVLAPKGLIPLGEILEIVQVSRPILQFHWGEILEIVRVTIYILRGPPRGVGKI